MKQFDEYRHSFESVFFASIGRFDFDIFWNGQDSYNPYWGSAYFLTFMAINVGLYMSLFVAITVALYGNVGDRGHIYHMLDTLEVRSVTEADKDYSALISLPAPLNVLHIFVSPILMTSSNPEAVNKAILWIAYLPVFIVTTVIFIAYSFLITPFCFVKIFFHKMIMIFVYSKTYRVSRADKFMTWVLFTIIGPFRLIANIFTDLIAFLQHMLATDLKKTKVTLVSKPLTKKGMRILNDYFAVRKDRLMPYKQFAEEVRDKLSIFEKIANFMKPPIRQSFFTSGWTAPKTIEVGENAEDAQVAFGITEMDKFIKDVGEFSTIKEFM